MTNKYKLVPIEPSDETLQKMRDFALKVELTHDYTWIDYMQELYSIAMLEAAPPADVEPDAYAMYDTSDLNNKCAFLADDPDLEEARKHPTAYEIPLYTHPPADKDAERYRWLRHRCVGIDASNHALLNLSFVVDGVSEKGMLDEAIDKAMEEV